MRPIPIVALDVPASQPALAIVDELGELCRFYKIGGELFTAVGPDVVRQIRERGAEVFLDLKFHDIPNTVRGAVHSAAALGARLVTVHAVGGSAMLRAAVEGAAETGSCGVLAVTLLTSLQEAEAGALWGRTSDFRAVDEVLRLAELAAKAGVLVVVCSGGEARAIKDRFGDQFAVLIPGVRLAGAAVQDQARVATPAEAASAGADYVVLGRTVTAAANRALAMGEVLAQLRGVRAGSGSLA